MSATATINDSDIGGYEQAHLTSVNESRADRIADDLLSDMLQSVINDLTGSNLNHHDSLSQRQHRETRRDSGDDAERGLSGA
jgi:hypothetical protein